MERGGCEEWRWRGAGGCGAKERGIKIFSEQNEVMTKYPPGVCRAEGVSGKKDCLGKGKANVSKESLYRHTERRHVSECGPFKGRRKRSKKQY